MENAKGAAKGPNLNSINEKADHLCNGLREELEQLRRVNDVVFGSLPQAENGKDIGHTANGMLGDITTKQDVAMSILSELADEIRRAERITYSVSIEGNYFADNEKQQSISTKLYRG